MTGEASDPTRDAGLDERDTAAAPDGPRPGDRAAPGGWTCEICGGSMLDRHCKLVCLRCGYQRDCSDP